MTDPALPAVRPLSLIALAVLLSATAVPGCASSASDAPSEDADVVVESDMVVIDTASAEVAPADESASDTQGPEVPQSRCGLGDLDPFARCDASWQGLGSLAGLAPAPNNGLYLVFRTADGNGTVVHLNAEGGEVGRVGVETFLGGVVDLPDDGVGLLEYSQDTPHRLSLVPVAADSPMAAPVVGEPQVGPEVQKGQWVTWVSGAPEPTVLLSRAEGPELVLSMCTFGVGAACVAHPAPLTCPEGTEPFLSQALAWPLAATSAGDAEGAGPILLAGNCSTPCDLFCNQFSAFVVPLSGAPEQWRPLGTWPFGSQPRLFPPGERTGEPSTERLWVDVEFAPNGYGDDGGGPSGAAVGYFSPDGAYTEVWRAPLDWTHAVPRLGLAIAGVWGLLNVGLTQWPPRFVDTLAFYGEFAGGRPNRYEVPQGVAPRLVGRLGFVPVVAFSGDKVALVRFASDGTPVAW